MTRPDLHLVANAPSAQASVLQAAADHATRFLDTLDDRAVGVSAAALARLAELDEPMPAAPSDPIAVLDLLNEVGSPAAIGSAGGRYFGFVVGGALPVTVGAAWLAAAWDQNAAISTLSPIGAALELVAQRWLLELFGLPADCGAAFVTGDTMANVSALAAARHAVLARVGWDVERDGLFGAPLVTVVVGDEVHVSVTKALRLLGFGQDRLIRAPVDDQGRMQPTPIALPDGPAIICTQVGNVNTGASDAVGEICDWAHKAGAWVHVDGAFGLWAAVAPERAHLVAAGIEQADSWATDGHKWLNVPYDSGVVIVRDEAALRGAMSFDAAYLPALGQREPRLYSPEMSRRARGVEIWAALKALGRDGVAEMVERCCRHAARFAEGLAGAGYEVLNQVDLNQVLVSFGTPEQTNQVIVGVQAEGTSWCGGTVWQGRTAMRISVSSWATTGGDVERSLAAMIAVARRVRQGDTAPGV